MRADDLGATDDAAIDPLRDQIPQDLIWALKPPAGDFRICWVNTSSAKLGCSGKHLTVEFGREFRMPPGLFARIVRRDRVASWAKLASVCGYADQTHLTRDFRELAGSHLRLLLGANCLTKRRLSASARTDREPGGRPYGRCYTARDLDECPLFFTTPPANGRREERAASSCRSLLRHLALGLMI
jgi:AraC-like DNA-binding protein